MNGEAPTSEDDPTVYVLNALWFKPGMASRYTEYLNASRPIVEAIGGAFLEPFAVSNALEGGFDPDLVFYGRYPSEEALWAMLASPEYQAVYHLREEAVERSVTSLCRAAELPRP